jgi:dTDP-4-amino-4,6-dideoxygalactose transaminase
MVVREIGGDFCLADLLCPVESESAYSRLLARWEQQAYLSTYSSGRAAYYAILKHMAAEAYYSLRALLPSCLCHTMLDPVLASGLDAVFYKIRADLSIDIDDLARLMHTGPSVIVICDYFGFRGWLQVFDDPHLPMTDDHLVLFDATHSALDQELWKTAVWKPDVYVVSPRLYR